MKMPIAVPTIASGSISRGFLLTNVVLTIFYFSWWFITPATDKSVMFYLLFLGETYHVAMVLMFWFTVRGLSKPTAHILPKSSNRLSVAVFVTVAGEPLDIVKDTVSAIKSAPYARKDIYILNDSFVAGKENWKEYEALAKELGVGCFTRTVPGGAKAGNINNALRQTSSDLVAIFDADMAPHNNFFAQTVPYFTEEKVGFVQTPQFYANSTKNVVTAAAWEQQEFFFGPIMRGKDSSNASFICGTNVVLRRTALEEVGGMSEKSIAEDFLTSLYIHKNGWKSIYVPEVLAEGLAPEDLLSYYKQQLRWARGSVEILFRHNPIFIKGLTWAQRIEYLSSALYYCNGLIVVINGVIPLVFLLTGISPINTTTTLFAIYFLPFIMSIIVSLHRISGKSLTFRAISFTQSSWYLQVVAIFSSLTGKKSTFAVTPKTAQSGNFLFLAYPHLIYISVAIISFIVAVNREGLSPSVITNVSWVLFNSLLFIPFISAAVPWKTIAQRFGFRAAVVDNVS